nr:hypothetical protein [Tanacetum cinerariifolium]
MVVMVRAIWVSYEMRMVKVGGGEDDDVKSDGGDDKD